jgi:hypothetical protein
MSLLLIAGYFAAGLGREFLVVSYYRQIARARAYSASGLAGGIELFDFLVLATIIQSGWSPTLIAAYVIGTMIGTFIATTKKRGG